MKGQITLPEATVSVADAGVIAEKQIRELARSNAAHLPQSENADDDCDCDCVEED
jgi:hypothetical protein